MSKLKKARRLELAQSVLMGSILGNHDFGDVPFEAQNADNLEEALQCYVNYGEFPESGNLEDFWEAYSKAVSSLEGVRMVEVVKTNVGDIPLSETPFEGIVKPLVTEEALALAKKHGFRLESDLSNPIIGLVKDKEHEHGVYYRAIVSQRIEYMKYVWEQEDPFFYYHPDHSLDDAAPHCYKEHNLPIPEWLENFKDLVYSQSLADVLLSNL